MLCIRSSPSAARDSPRDLVADRLRCNPGCLEPSVRTSAAVLPFSARPEGRRPPSRHERPAPASSTTAEPSPSLRAPLHPSQTRTHPIGGLRMLRATFQAKPSLESSPNGRDRPSPAPRRRGTSVPATQRRRQRPCPSWPPDPESAARIRTSYPFVLDRAIAIQRPRSVDTGSAWLSF